MGTVNVGAYVLHLRTARGLSRAKLAEMVGSTEMNLLRVEKQGQEPSAGLLIRLITTLSGSWDIVSSLEAVPDSEDALEKVIAEVKVKGAALAEVSVFTRFLDLVESGMSPSDAARRAREPS